MYGSWDMEHNRQDFFFPPPSNNPEYQNFENMKKTPGDIIILYTYVP